MGTMVLALGVTACSNPGDDFLADSGPGLDWVGAAEQRPTVATATPTTLPQWTDAAALAWVNDDLATSSPDDPPGLVAEKVYLTSSGTDRYVQAAASDIAAALPGIDVPAALPSSVTHVSSQLVFDVADRRLGDDPAAAFGFWVVEPYTQSRSVGQRAVMLVSLDADSVEQIPDAESVCRRFSARGSCEAVTTGERNAWWILGDEETLVWYEAPHRYELEVRGVGRDVAEEIASELVALSDVVDAVGVVAASG